ncbi:hemerythrin domain-containing protein [Chloroflexota bacterium]
MDETIELIAQLIEEHKIINKTTQDLEREVNDVDIGDELDRAKEAFVPGRFQQKEGLLRLKELLEAADKRIETHFNREETSLLIAFERNAVGNLVSELRSLLSEHGVLREQMVHTKELVAELVGGELSHQSWEAKANDLRAYISRNHKLLLNHARKELEIFLKIKSQLEGTDSSD